MIQQTSKNNKDKDSINTRSIQFMNSEGFDPSTLVMGHWNDKLSIKIHPALDKNKQTASNVFDYEVAITTALPADKIQTLINGIESCIIPAINNKEDKSIAVVLNLNSLLSVGTGVGHQHWFMIIMLRQESLKLLLINIRN